MTPWRVALPALLLLALLPAQRARAIGSLARGEISLQATGSLRITGAFLHYPDGAAGLLPAEGDGLAAAVARLLLEGGLAARVDYRANLFFELSRSPAALGGGALATAGSFASPYRNSRLAWDAWESGAVAGRLGLDRLSVDVHLAPLELSVGRMPLNYSVTQILTPNDLFAPFSAAAINKVYKPGVDALRLNHALGPLASLELAAVMGSDAAGVPRWAQTALLTRASAVAWGVQWAVLGGKLAERWFVGASLQGEAGPLGLRAEGHVGFPDIDGDGRLDADEPQDYDSVPGRRVHLHAAAGVDHTFDWRSLNLAFEAMYLSDGGARPALYAARLARLLPDELLYLNRMYLALSVSGEILPILRAAALALWNTQDLSGLAALTLIYSAADEVDVAGGLLLPWGARSAADAGAAGAAAAIESEYGLVPLTVFVESRVYF